MPQNEETNDLHLIILCKRTGYVVIATAILWLLILVAFLYFTGAIVAGAIESIPMASLLYIGLRLMLRQGNFPRYFQLLLWITYVLIILVSLLLFQLVFAFIVVSGDSGPVSEGFMVSLFSLAAYHLLLIILFPFLIGFWKHSCRRKKGRVFFALCANMYETASPAIISV